LLVSSSLDSHPCSSAGVPSKFTPEQSAKELKPYPLEDSPVTGVK
jgi:hypothetical protein